MEILGTKISFVALSFLAWQKSNKSDAELRRLLKLFKVQYQRQISTFVPMRILLLLIFTAFFTSKSNYEFAVVKYNGGGDWYANPTSLTNLISFCNKELNTNIAPEYATVDLSSNSIFKYPFIHLTGHGNVVLSDEEKANLTKYLMAGGFLHVDDNYGMDKYIRPLLNQLLPDTELEQLPANHPIFQSPYSFPNGLPKIHEHDNKPPEAYALFFQGRMVVLYTYECDLGDGWEDGNVHNDSPEIRLKALQMGANIVNYVLSGE